MTDHGPHSHVCSSAEGGVCHCDCHGARHGVAHVPGGRIRHDPEVDVRISRIHKPGGGYRVTDRKTGLPPGGGTPDERDQAKRETKPGPAETKEQRIARRAAEVTTRTQADLDGKPSLSPGLHARVKAAREAMPADRKGWQAPVDRNLKAAAELRARVEKAKQRLAEEKELRQTELDHHDRVYADFSPRLRTKYREEFDKTWDDRVEAREVELSNLESYLHEAENPQYEATQYPRTADGQVRAPDEWNAHLKTVMGVGRDVLAEHRAGLARDPEHKRLTAEAERLEAQAARDRELIFNPVVPADVKYQDWRQARREATNRYGGPDGVREQAVRARVAVAQHDQARLMSMLTSHRTFGGTHHDVEVLAADQRQPAYTPGELGSLRGKARSDAREMFRKAEGFYPQGWLDKATARPKLQLGSSDRAYYSDGGTRPNSAPSFLAMPAEGNDRNYAGGHGTGSEAGSLDVTVHELGHRMEKSVPGLTQLEMAFVLSRSTSHAGELEKPKQIEGPGYRAGEISYHDTWADPYAGKTYSGTDPGSQHWEVFQVGVQDLYGRMNRFDKSDDLQAFVIGALLTL